MGIFVIHSSQEEWEEKAGRTESKAGECQGFNERGSAMRRKRWCRHVFSQAFVINGISEGHGSEGEVTEDVEIEKTASAVGVGLIYNITTVGISIFSMLLRSNNVTNILRCINYFILTGILKG